MFFNFYFVLQIFYVCALMLHHQLMDYWFYALAINRREIQVAASLTRRRGKGEYSTHYRTNIIYQLPTRHGHDEFTSANGT